MLGYADELQTLWDNALVGAVHNQQGKGNVAQGEQAIKFQSSEYWHPNMSAYEVTLVERIANRELDTTDNYIDEANKWLYKKRVIIHILHYIAPRIQTILLFCMPVKAKEQKMNMRGLWNL